MPPEIVVSTRDSGATASATTCSVQATNAMAKPIVHQRDRNSPAALRSGWVSSTAGDATAPRYLQSNPTFATSAHASASSMPSWTISPWIDPFSRRA
jgi:hypothetical protein